MSRVERQPSAVARRRSSAAATTTTTAGAIAACVCFAACGGSGDDGAGAQSSVGGTNAAAGSNAIGPAGSNSLGSGGTSVAGVGGSPSGGQATTGGASSSGIAGSGSSGAPTGSSGANTGGSGGNGAAGSGGTGVAGSSGSGAGGSAGAPSNPALDAACTPTTAVFTNNDPTGGGKVFLQSVSDTQTFIKNAAHQVCTILYRQASEVPKISTVTLVIESSPGNVADTGGSTTRFYSEYIESFAQGHDAADTLYEFQGVIHHEFTHIYQNHNGGLGVIEGGADFVRYRSGYIPDSNRHKGGNWDDGYQTSAFFFVYLDDTYKDFFYKLNLAEKGNPGDQVFVTLTGKDVNTLWTAYQASF